MDEEGAEITSKKEPLNEVDVVMGNFSRELKHWKDYIKREREEVMKKPWEPWEIDDWTFEVLLKGGGGVMRKCGFTGKEGDKDQEKIAKVVAQFFYNGNRKVFKECYERKRVNGRFLEKITAGKNEHVLYKEAEDLFKESST
jgi:hypothetical protein